MIQELIRKQHNKIVNGPNYKWWALVVVQFGLFFVGVNGTIVNLALPSISLAFESPVSLSQLLIVVYSTTIAIFLPITGQLPHFFGRKIVVISGFLLFTFCSVLSALSPTLEILIALQIFLAIGSAALLANSNAITHAVFPSHQHGFAMGINATVASVGYGIGLVVGGYLIERFGWRSIYWLNLPFGLSAILLGLFILSEKKIIGAKHPEKKHSFDYLGAILFALFFSSCILLLKEARGKYAMYLIGSSGLALILFVMREMKASFPLINIALFKNKNLTIGATTRLLITIIYSACLLLIPFYTQIDLKFTPLQSGMIMLPFSLALFFLGPFGGKLSDKKGSIWITSLGFAICTVGIIILTTLSSRHDLALNAIKIAVSMFCIGWGVAFFVPSNNSTTLNAIPAHDVGVVSGFMWSMAYLGTAIGTALCGVLVFQAHGIKNVIRNKEVLEKAIPSTIFDSILSAQNLVFQILIAVSITGLLFCLSRYFTKKIKRNK